MDFIKMAPNFLSKLDPNKWIWRGTPFIVCVARDISKRKVYLSELEKLVTERAIKLAPSFLNEIDNLCKDE